MNTPPDESVTQPDESPAEIAERIRRRALAEGFDIAGVAPPDLPAEIAERLSAFLADGRHGDMAWMAARANERASPRQLWPEARSVVMVGMNYGPDADPTAILGRRDRGAISVYAQNRDYHDVLKKRLKSLGRWIVSQWPADVKVFVDTAPVMEKPLAALAGIGWQGKHTNLVSRSAGSWLFLGAVFTTLDLPPDAPESDHCGQCRRCLDVCPTNAFPAPFQLDARRCISYLTIEHQGHIPRDFRAQIGNRIYGCDDCLAVCPWNKFAQTARETAFHPRADLTAPALEDLAGDDDDAFRRRFSGSPVKRVKRDRFVRNVAIAIGNSADPALTASAQRLTRDESPLVRVAAVWALARLADPEAFEASRRVAAPVETDPDVLDEWRRGSEPPAAPLQ